MARVLYRKFLVVRYHSLKRQTAATWTSAMVNEVVLLSTVILSIDRVRLRSVGLENVLPPPSEPQKAL